MRNTYITSGLAGLLAIASVITLPTILSGCANMREGKYMFAPYGSVGTEPRTGRPYDGLNHSN